MLTQNTVFIALRQLPFHLACPKIRPRHYVRSLNTCIQRTDRYYCNDIRGDNYDTTSVSTSNVYEPDVT